MTLFRYKLTVEYTGTGFVGWQRQKNGFSVQQALEEAAARFCGRPIILYAAGRTDAGVHALGQVAHLELPQDYPAPRVRDALNAQLRPHPISVISAEPVDPHFHARFSAIERRYLYRIVNRRAPLALALDRAWWVPGPLDDVAMAEAATVLLGRHDFSTFRASECQADSPLRTLDELSVRRDGNEILITARARSFLHHQVRNMVGTLRRVGEGKWNAENVALALAARDRRAGGQTAPAHGLYLTGVGY